MDIFSMEFNYCMHCYVYLWRNKNCHQREHLNLKACKDLQLKGDY